MKKKNNSQMMAAIIIFLLALPFSAIAQDSAKRALVLNVSYYMINNKVVYLMVHTKTKIAKKFQPVTGVNINLFIDSDSSGNHIGSVTTDKNGEGKAIIPPGLKTVWERSPNHTLLAVSEANKEFESTSAEALITKSKITIDTLADAEARTIVVNVSSFNGSAWMPVPAVEMKVGVHRISGSILSAGDEPTYTTDSTGTVNAEFKKEQLPGDEKGNIVLTAKVEDNEQLGNLVIEKTVPWGVTEKIDNGFFDQRTLWSTRFRTPLWLLFMAYSIVIGVWGTIIYLVFQIIKIKKLGTAASAG
jgi:hypothetical protein